MNNNTPIDVNSDTTPITKQPVEQILSDQWNTMNVSELYDQLRILQNRYYAALDMRKGNISLQLERGIDHLRSLIAIKQEEAQRRGIYEVR